MPRRVISRPSRRRTPDRLPRAGASEGDGLETGKLPAALLRQLVLDRLGVRRPETLIGAAVGIDAAAIALGAERACVLTTDPITTATTGSGRLAVHVVCNDLATMGAEPVGVLATLLFPVGTTPEQVGDLTSEIATTCRSLNVEVLGGHTEIAPGVVTPLVVMTGVGQAPRDRLITAGGGRPGDRLVLTKAAALEGSHILANDFAAELTDLTPGVLAAASAYADELSVVPEARIAVAAGAVALHDPTEGGIVGAAWEMAEASGCGFEIDVASVPVREPTRLICAALGADPLRLMASGALLIAVGDAPGMITALESAGIPATAVGVLTAGTARLLVDPNGMRELIEGAPRDEMYRLHASRARGS